MTQILLVSGVLLLSGTYWLQTKQKRAAAAITLLLGLAALLAPWILAVPSKRTVAPSPPGPTQFQIDLGNQLHVERMRAELTDAETRKDRRRLARHEATVYSQFGEDGIIDEIFRRIGSTNRYFVEFGSGDGKENNTVLLLLGGWSGLWMDAQAEAIRTAEEKFRAQIAERRLVVRPVFVNAENIEELLTGAGVPPSFDLLSIDIDRNDYWVWNAIRSYRPRVVVIEYNAVFPPGISWAVNYEPSLWWDGTSHFGASLTALERLGRQKGYALVGCNLLGSNAFFVREELAGDKFAAPFTAENHYQPARYYMVWYKSGHPRSVGPPGLLELPSAVQEPGQHRRGEQKTQALP